MEKKEKFAGYTTVACCFTCTHAKRKLSGMICQEHDDVEVECCGHCSKFYPNK